jgi:hypothetical protein
VIQTGTKGLVPEQAKPCCVASAQSTGGMDDGSGEEDGEADGAWTQAG